MMNWWSIAPAFHKRVLDPAMMRVAGRRYWYAAVIRHVGRRSGTVYATPVVVERVESGFIIPLTCGTKPTGCATSAPLGTPPCRSGETYDVTEPEVIAAAFPQVRAVGALVWRLRIEHYLKVTLRTDRR